MMKIAYSDQCKHLLITELSRLGRNVFELQKLIDELMDIRVCLHIQNINLCTLDEKGKRSHLTSLILFIIGQFA